MRQYHNFLENIIDFGSSSPDRTKTGTISVPGEQMRFNLKDGFPLLTTKFVPFRLVASELLWMLSGSTNAKALQEQNNHIWDEWCDERGNLGPIYGAQWRDWGGDDQFPSAIDQIKALIDGLRERPFSRRHIVSAWNVVDLPDESLSPQENVRVGKMALAPCHCLFQLHVREIHGERYLTCILFQRSCDAFLGGPFNVASYALLTHMIAQQVDMIPDWLIWNGGNSHIYLNHTSQVRELLSRDPERYPLPTLELDKAPDLFSYTLDHMRVVGYKHYPAIKAPIAV